jgi:hypothetical protein
MVNVGKRRDCQPVEAACSRRFPWCDVAILSIGGACALISINSGITSTLIESTAAILLLLGGAMHLINVFDKFIIHRGVPAGKSRAMRYAGAALFALCIGWQIMFLLRATVAARQRAASTTVVAAIENGDLKLTVPGTWRRSSGFPAMDLAVEGPEGAVLVEDGRLEPGTAIGTEVLRELAESLFGSWRDYQVTPVRSRETGNGEWYVLEITVRDPETDVPWRIQLHLICKSNSFLVMRLIAPADSWSWGRPVLERIAESCTMSTSDERPPAEESL